MLTEKQMHEIKKGVEERDELFKNIILFRKNRSSEFFKILTIDPMIFKR